MIEAEQFSLDLEGANLETRLQDQWRQNREATAHETTTEAMAKVWSGYTDWDHWNSLPRYERARIVEMYECEQSNLAWKQEIWRPIAATCDADGTVHFYPPRPHHIRDFKSVEIRIDPKELEERWNQAKEMAETLAGDWSAERPATVRTYDPSMASMVSQILGRKVEAVLPENRVDWHNVPMGWLLHHAIIKSPAFTSRPAEETPAKPSRSRSKI